MPTLFLMCGLPAAGKTTLAKQMEQGRLAIRLTPDEWMEALFQDGYDEQRRLIIEGLLWEVAAQALQLGVNVVLDFGFWSRRERDDYRARAAAVGAQTEVHFLDVPLDELSRRVALRNAALPPYNFRIEEADLQLWATWFEPPDSAELEIK